MLPILFLLAGMLLSGGACSSTSERQWYKPGPYTVAEFQRDEAACTKGRQLDEDCLKARGWVPLSPDAKPAAKTTVPRRGY